MTCSHIAATPFALCPLQGTRPGATPLVRPKGRGRHTRRGAGAAPGTARPRGDARVPSSRLLGRSQSADCTTEAVVKSVVRVGPVIASLSLSGEAISTVRRLLTPFGPRAPARRGETAGTAPHLPWRAVPGSAVRRTCRRFAPRNDSGLSTVRGPPATGLTDRCNNRRPPSRDRCGRQSLGWPR